MTPAERAECVLELRDLAARFDAVAERADTITDEDERRRQAQQLRFVAVLVGTCGYDEMGPLWIAAASRMLDAYDLADIDAVHASRASRGTNR